MYRHRLDTLTVGSIILTIRRHTFILLVQALEPTDQQVRGGLSDEASQDLPSHHGENWGFTIKKCDFHWIGLRENLQETIVFTIKYRAFL